MGWCRARVPDTIKLKLDTLQVTMWLFILSIEALKMLKMHNPPHPGEVVKELCLKPLNLSVTEAAAGLGISRKALSELINGRTGISPTMAVRLSIAFGGSPDSWLMQQMQYELWQIRKSKKKLHVRCFKKAS